VEPLQAWAVHASKPSMSSPIRSMQASCFVLAHLTSWWLLLHLLIGGAGT